MAILERAYDRIECRHGTFTINLNDTYVGRSLRRYGEWSEAELALFARFIEPGATVVEAGANIGAHTVWLSQRVGENGTVIAFEPSRLTFQLLCANLAGNERFNVIARAEGLGAKRMTAALPSRDPRTPFNFGATSFHDLSAERTESVDILPLDDLGLSRLDLLKADVEGMELDVLDGALETISRCRPVVYVEINSLHVRDGAILRLSNLGYHGFYYITSMYNSNNWNNDPEDVFNYYSFDLILIPQERFSCSGLPSASLGDDNYVVEGDAVRWRAHDWREAMITRLEPQGDL